MTATLIAEIGTAMTRLALVDLVDGAFRLLARAEAPSSLAAPPADVAQAVLELAGTIASVTGRELVKDGQLLVPSDGNSMGVSSVVVTTSAAGLFPIVITALGAQQSAREAVHAAHGSYSAVEYIFSLGEGGMADEIWLGQQVAQLGQTKPDVVLIAGGLEGGAVSAMQRLGHVVGLLARTVNPRPRIIYAGNSAAADIVRSALGDDNDLQVVANLRPTARSNRLEPTRSALRAHYAERVLPTLPGYENLRTWQARYIGTVAEDQGIIVRFLAERFGRNILALDIGSTHSAAHLQADDHYSEVILANLGTGPGSVGLLEAAGVSNIGRWLPFPIAARDLVNRLLNRSVQPYRVPADVEDLLIDHALIRESVCSAVSKVRESRARMRYDLVIGGGAIARAPRPGFAALSLLDALALDGQRSHLAIDLYLDSLGLLAAGGALAHIDPDAAASMIERDALNNGPLATVITPYGSLKRGDPALDVELTPWVDGQASTSQKLTVVGGQIACLPLPRGQRGALRITPSPDVSIGDNAPGAEVWSDEAAISGSALGIIIDARPRPLTLPEDDDERRALLVEWLEALDALPARFNDQSTTAAPADLDQLLADAEPGTPQSEPETLLATRYAEAGQDTPLSEPETFPVADAAAPEPETMTPDIDSTLDQPMAIQPDEAEGDQSSETEGSSSDMEDQAPEQSEDVDSLSALQENLVEPPKPKRGFFRRHS